MGEYRAAEWRNGLRCVRCGDSFEEGEPYAEVPDSFAREVLVTEVLHIRCVSTEEGEG